MKKIIRVIVLTLVVIVAFVCGLELSRNRIPFIIRNITDRIDKTSKADKFSLEFQVNYLNVVPVGEALFHFDGIYQYDGHPYYFLKLEARDTIPLSWLKPAKTEMITYVDIVENLPRRLLLRLEVDGSVKEEKEIIYNHKEGFMLSKDEKYKILPQTKETLSLFFYLMKQDFSLGQVLDLNFNSNQANYRTKVEVKDKKKYLVQGKEYSVWELNISVRRRTGGMRHSFDAKAFFLENTNMRIPLLVKGSTNLGNILLRLEGIR